MNETRQEMTFWEHLDVLRGVLLRMLMSMVALSLVAFALKQPLFDAVLAPSTSQFVTYQLLHTEPFELHLVNIGLTEQFMVHVKTAFMAGLLIAMPYMLYVLYRFVAPALYVHERRYAVCMVASGYVMFILGVLVCYFMAFPLTVYFLGTYSVSGNVQPMLSLQSYTGTLFTMCMVFGAVFEMPLLCWLLGEIGLLRAAWMAHYRKHAVVVILIVAAVITPSGDAFTLLVVSLPVWLLYEAGIVVVKKVEKKRMR